MKISKSAVIATAVFLLVSAGCIKGALGTGASYKDGTYKVSANGRNAPVELEVVFAGGKAKAVNVISQEESFFAQEAFTKIPDAFIHGKNVDKIDAVSGATLTSNAIKAALKEAQKQASAQ